MVCGRGFDSRRLHQVPAKAGSNAGLFSISGASRTRFHWYDPIPCFPFPQERGHKCRCATTICVHTDTQRPAASTI